MSVTITHNTEYSMMQSEVLKVRDCVKGSPFIKAKKAVYLPHPSSVDKVSERQIERYKNFLAGAEFDEFTSNTERVMLGKLKLDDMEFEPPEKLSYLYEDVDNDGLSMRGLVESCAKNVMEVKWHLLVAEYQGMQDLGLEQVSAQDIKDANPRATIKQYPRESVIDWDFDRINGKMQLTYLVVTQAGYAVDQESGSRKEVTSVLKFGIDETGYYQQKKNDISDTGSDFGEKHYVTVGGSNIKFIPASIACDEEFQAGSLPMELGFLAPIADMAIFRYQMSAAYKEAMRTFSPTLVIYGMSKAGWEEFVEVNGRNYWAMGSTEANIVGDPQVRAELIEAQGSLIQFTDYFEDNKNKVRALGGVFKTDQSAQRTATEVVIEADNATAALTPMANSIESAIAWQVAYCAMFEGIIKPDELSKFVEDLDFALAKDFAVSKLTVEEVKAILDVHMAGIFSKEEVARLLSMGGWTDTDVDELIASMDEVV